MTARRWTDEMVDELAETTAQLGVYTREVNQRVDQTLAELRQLRLQFEQRMEHSDQQMEQFDQRFEQSRQEDKERFEKLTEEFKEQGIRFNAYQQGMQWVVQLAFTLIASATLTVIITTIAKR